MEEAIGFAGAALRAMGAIPEHFRLPGRTRVGGQHNSGQRTPHDGHEADDEMFFVAGGATEDQVPALAHGATKPLPRA